MNTNTQDRQFLEMIRRFLARAAITASAVRNQGGAGVAERAREAAFSLDLGRFASAQDFAKHLDDATEEMKAALPRPARTWGLSRKLVNIFLRDCLYCVYSRDAYKLSSAELHFEVPLDSITMERIRAGCPNRLSVLAVKKVSPETSEQYEAAAQELADAQHIARVHLDAYWWGARK